MFIAIPPSRGGLWHIFTDSAKSLCGKVEVQAHEKRLPVDGEPWIKGQDCKPCWVAARMPVGDGLRSSQTTSDGLAASVV